MENMELINYQSNLPVTLENLKKFVLVGREKLAAVIAEIRAIETLDLAQQVRSQKMEEARMLSEVLLDAEMKIGELLSKLPKGSGGNRRGQGVTVLFCEDTEKTKSEAIRELGFAKTQAHYFETLAENRELVEKVKAEAKENNQIPSKTMIINRIQEQRKRDKPEKQQQQKNQEQPVIQEHITVLFSMDDDTTDNMDSDTDSYDEFCNILSEIQALDVDDQQLSSWSERFKKQLFEEHQEIRVNELLPKIYKIQNFLNRFSTEE